VNKYVRAIQRHWTFGGSLRYRSSIPIISPTRQITFRLYSRNRRAHLPIGRPGVNLFTQDPNGHYFDPNATFVLNPAQGRNLRRASIVTPHLTTTTLTSPTAKNSKATPSQVRFG
jgi:hypothetical protein